jgi:hypothetical protein
MSPKKKITISSFHMGRTKASRKVLFILDYTLLIQFTSIQFNVIQYRQ